jgi:ABC-type sugar transport system ATPase subunit
VRPHDIDIVASEEGDVSAHVDIVEPLGAVTLIRVRADDLSEELIRVVVPSEVRVEVSDHVNLRLRRDRVHRFDGNTGQRMN